MYTQLNHFSTLKLPILSGSLGLKPTQSNNSSTQLNSLFCDILNFCQVLFVDDMSCVKYRTLLPSSNGVSTTVWLHHLNFNEMLGEKAS